MDATFKALEIRLMLFTNFGSVLLPTETKYGLKNDGEFRQRGAYYMK